MVKVSRNECRVDERYSLDEVAARLQVSTTTLIRWMKSGKLSFPFPISSFKQHVFSDREVRVIEEFKLTRNLPAWSNAYKTLTDEEICSIGKEIAIPLSLSD
jgi:predicted DNA-binding transcriptional regulator AlpA